MLNACCGIFLLVEEIEEENVLFVCCVSYWELRIMGVYGLLCEVGVALCYALFCSRNERRGGKSMPLVSLNVVCVLLSDKSWVNREKNLEDQS